MRVVPHGRLPAEAELVARQILRNSQRAVRSAKETILEVIGKPLDDQLRIEGWNSYTCVDRDEAAALLDRFYGRTDAGRAGANATPLAGPESDPEA
jgi:enoyl-CoA hydratase/carnithine racemase